MTFKRFLMPMLILGIMFTMGNMAYAQLITCGITTAGIAAGPTAGTLNPLASAPAMPGVTSNGSNVGHTEVVGAGATGVPDGTPVPPGGPTSGIPGNGRVRIVCTNSNPGPFVAPATALNTPVTTVNPGVVALTVSFGVPITNNTVSYPSLGSEIRPFNGTGDFAVNTTSSAVGGTNVAINLLSASGGSVVVALGSGAGGAAEGATPTGGITFSGNAAGCGTPAPGTCGPVTSTFELAGVLLSTNGKSGAITATLTSSGGINIVAGSITACSTTASPGPCSVVINNVQNSLVDPAVATGSLPTSVTGQPNLGSTPIAGGAAVLNSSGGAVKSNFTIRIQEVYADMFKSQAQFNGGGVFPASPASSVQVNIALSNIPTGFDISGCSAVLTDVSGNNPVSPFSPTSAAVSATTFTSATPTLTVLFTGPVDPNNVDVLWVTCTRVAAGTATLPLPSTPITAQVFLGPVGSNTVSTSLTTGQIPRYQQALVPATPITVVVFPPANTVLLLTFGFVGPGYNTGIAVANTTTDPFGVAGGGGTPTSGTVTFLLVKNDGTSKSYTTTTGSPGSGLTGAGVVASGSTYVVNLSEILTAASFGTGFSGYVFISANFTFAHGAATIYTTSTGAAALSSPVLVVTNSAGSGISSAAPRSAPESLGQ